MTTGQRDGGDQGLANLDSESLQRRIVEPVQVRR